MRNAGDRLLMISDLEVLLNVQRESSVVQEQQAGEEIERKAKLQKHHL